MRPAEEIGALSSLDSPPRGPTRGAPRSLLGGAALPDVHGVCEAAATPPTTALPVTHSTPAICVVARGYSTNARRPRSGLSCAPRGPQERPCENRHPSARASPRWQSSPASIFAHVGCLTSEDCPETHPPTTKVVAASAACAMLNEAAAAGDLVQANGGTEVPNEIGPASSPTCTAQCGGIVCTLPVEYTDAFNASPPGGVDAGTDGGTSLTARPCPAASAPVTLQCGASKTCG